MDFAKLWEQRQKQSIVEDVGAASQAPDGAKEIEFDRTYATGCATLATVNMLT